MFCCGLVQGFRVEDVGRVVGERGGGGGRRGHLLQVVAAVGEVFEESLLLRLVLDPKGKAGGVVLGLDGLAQRVEHLRRPSQSVEAVGRGLEVGVGHSRLARKVIETPGEAGSGYRIGDSGDRLQAAGEVCHPAANRMHRVGLVAEAGLVEVGIDDLGDRRERPEGGQVVLVAGDLARRVGVALQQAEAVVPILEGSPRGIGHLGHLAGRHVGEGGDTTLGVAHRGELILTELVGVEEADRVVVLIDHP